MSMKNRLAKLEQQQPPLPGQTGAPEVDTRYTDAEHNRSWEALAAALSDTTGEAVTATEAQQALLAVQASIKELNHEQP